MRRVNKNTSANKTVHAKPQPPSFAWLQIGGGTSHGGGARLWPGVRRQRGISTRPRQARVCPGPLLYFFFFFFFFGLFVWSWWWWWWSSSSSSSSLWPLSKPWTDRRKEERTRNEERGTHCCAFCPSLVRLPVTMEAAVGSQGCSAARGIFSLGMGVYALIKVSRVGVAVAVPCVGWV